jgi:hypothetical protein
MEVRTSNTRTIGICVRRRVQFKPNQYHNLSSPVLKSIFRELDTAAPQIEKKSFPRVGLAHKFEGLILAWSQGHRKKFDKTFLHSD